MIKIDYIDQTYNEFISSYGEEAGFSGFIKVKNEINIKFELKYLIFS